MSVEENKELIRRYSEADATDIRRSLAQDEYHAPELVLHTPTGDLNYEQNHSFLSAEIAAFPDAKYLCDDLVAEGIRWWLDTASPAPTQARFSA